MDIDDDDMLLLALILDDDDDEQKESSNKPAGPGRGNALAGRRNPYILHSKSNVYPRLSAKQHLLRSYTIFKPADFEKLCDELFSEWVKPRNGSCCYRSRKHDIYSSLIGTFSIIRGGLTLHQAEAMCGIDKSLIYIDLYRNCRIMNQVLDKEMCWPSHEEQLLLLGMNDTFDSCIIIDCMDCKLKTRSQWLRYLYVSWKTGVGYRNMLAVDLRGQIRACLSIPAGFNNDQWVLTVCNFFRKGSLVDGTTCMGDGAFTGNEDFRVDKPWTRAQVRSNPALQRYNDALAQKRNIVERVNGIVKMQWTILREAFPFEPCFFPMVFRVCCLLTNRYFRLYGYPQ